MKPESVLKRPSLIKSIRPVDVAIVAAAILGAIGFWIRNIILIALAIPLGIYVVSHKAKTKAEKDRRENLALRSFAVSLFIPIIIVFILVIIFIIRIVPEIISALHLSN